MTAKMQVDYAFEYLEENLPESYRPHLALVKVRWDGMDKRKSSEVWKIKAALETIQKMLMYGHHQVGDGYSDEYDAMLRRHDDEKLTFLFRSIS